jgi:hypothetical protein
MRSFKAVCASTLVLNFALIGCQTHQSKVDALKKEYDRLNQQFANDCSAELLKVPPDLSPKCADEDKQLKEAWNRLQAERTKQ